MSSDRLQALSDAGQSIWLDFIDRTMLQNGDLQRRIREDGLTGMTSNPSIFEKALAEGTEYDDQLRAAPQGMTAEELFEDMATDDVRSACDIFRPVYEATHGGDGFVSIEVSPALAHESGATVEEARRLWRTVARPNVMVKVPGTAESVHAMRQLVAEGINVNVTLLFALDAYRSVISAYIEGIESRVKISQPVEQIASVASFFVSRVDTEVDNRLGSLVAGAGAEERGRIDALHGKAAIANAKLAYALFRERFAGDRWEALAARGARLQRPLWASTSTKNPEYRDVRYVEELIGRDTVITMPPATIDAFRDHGETALTVTENVDEAERTLQDLEDAGISMRAVTDKLLVDGLASFRKSHESLLAGLTRKTRTLGRTVAPGARAPSPERSRSDEVRS